MQAVVETAARSFVSEERARRLNSIGNRYWKRRVRARYIMSFELFTRVDHVAAALRKASILYIFKFISVFIIIIMIITAA